MKPKTRHAVRQLYDFRCGYCGVSEADTGGELTVDHYHPVSAGGGDEPENLVYCCYRCNLYKLDFAPNEDDVMHEHRVLHPREDDVSLHYVLEETAHILRPLTPTGDFHITLLHLNREQLQLWRSGKRLASLYRKRIALMERQIEEQASLNEILRRIRAGEAV